MRKIILQVIVIYKYPTDYPDKFVAREQRVWNDGQIESKDELFAMGDSLDEIREKIPQHLVCLQRNPEDAPSIIETWI